MLRRSIPLLARSVRTHIPTATAYIRTMSSAVPKTMKAVQVSGLGGPGGARKAMSQDGRPVHRCALDIVLPAGLARVTKAARG